MDLVTVIIPVFNYGFCLPETIGSLQAQTHSHWEALVIDDGSSDDTEAVAKRLARDDERIKYHYQSRRGVSAARNFGIDHAAGDYLLFLDGDDLITPNKLAEQVLLLKHCHAADMCYSDVYYFRNDNKDKLFFGKSGNRKWTIKLSGNSYEIIREFIRKNKFTIHSPLVRTGFLKDNGLKFDESLSHNEDWDFWLRCLFYGAIIRYLTNPAAYGLVRVHARSASYRSLKMDLATITVRERIKNYVRSSSSLTTIQKDNLLKLNHKKMRGPLKKMIYYNLHSFANLKDIYRTQPPTEFFICFIKALNEKRKDFFNDNAAVSIRTKVG